MHRLAAIDIDGLSGHEIARRRGEKHHSTYQILGHLHALEVQACRRSRVRRSSPTSAWVVLRHAAQAQDDSRSAEPGASAARSETASGGNMLSGFPYLA